MPKVSVITVCLNSAATIRFTIESVCRQTYPDLEYIVIDGGSTDGTIEMLETFHQQKLLMYRSEPDEGIYDAMNKGLKLSTGEWVYFLGSDDVFMDDKVLERIFSRSYTSEEVIYGNVRFKHKNIIYDGPFNQEKISEKNICHQALFVKKNLFAKIGGFKLKYKISADYEFNMRWMGRNTPSVYVNETIAVYNEEGISGQVSDLPFQEDFDRLLIENNIICRRAFLSLKKKYKRIENSKRYQLGDFLLSPFSRIKNRLT